MLDLEALSVSLLRSKQLSDIEDELADSLFGCSYLELDYDDRGYITDLAHEKYESKEY